MLLEWLKPFRNTHGAFYMFSYQYLSLQLTQFLMCIYKYLKIDFNCSEASCVHIV